MAEYTPTEGDARNCYAAGRIVLGSRDAGPPSERDAEFDRWLAEVRREAAEKAWDEGWDARHHYDERGGEPAPSNPHTKEANRG